ncbi:MAG: hypothetical protein HC822_15725 [Oscillochloris sp.]|nr:hypothetical protein [Oscillochloris sp.]
MKRIYLLLPAILLTLLASLAPVAAEPLVPPGLHTQTVAAGVMIRYSADPSETTPTTQVFAVLPNAEIAPPQLTQVRQEPWFGPLPPSSLPDRVLPDGSRYPARSGAVSHPDAPLSLLHETHFRGQRMLIYALNPIYRSNDRFVRLLELEAQIAAAQLFDPAQMPDHAALNGAQPASVSAPNPQAARNGWEITVHESGMQVLDSAQLQAAGLDPQAINVSRLHLYRAGEPVALEEIRSGATLRELRFYAPTPGNRYDPVDRYWLFLESTPGLRISTRDAQPDGAELSTTGLAQGSWYAPTSYDSRLPGSDGDHFFSVDLRTAPLEPGLPPEPAVISFTLSLPLPAAAGETVVDLDGSSLFDTDHRLRVTLGNTNRESVWSGDADWAFQLRFPTFPDLATISLLPGATFDGVHLNRVRWERPVDLRFGNQGALFFSRSGAWTYDLRETPAGAVLYDLSDAANPQRLSTQVSGGSFRFRAGDSRAYLLAGPGTLITPQIAPRLPLDLAALPRADGIYITPRAWLEHLEPLLALRRTQGYSVIAVPVEAIYAGWSHGRVSPAAIRAFLRYAAANWNPPPKAVTLVGDGNSDPYDYFGTGWPNWIPPYLLPVDPWLGETACETCYVQLDGEHPLDDLLPDLAIGRLPVKSEAELDQLIAKISGYEQSVAPGRWRARVAYIADNADLAGDFSVIADASAAGQPSGVEIARVYYDPDAPPEQSWRTRDPLAATSGTLTTYNNGAAVLVYLGHGLQFQWAVTGAPLTPTTGTAPNYLLNVDSARDTRNQLRLPITLTMTCLTSAFQIPSFRGTTIDEALLLHSDGGAIAVLGSSGLGVLYGHEALMRGFFSELWREAKPASVGELALAGYSYLAATSTDTNAIRSFVLLGDALTQPQIRADASAIVELNLPILAR